jgi:hypothetical protein
MKMASIMIIILFTIGCSKTDQFKTGTYSFVEISKLELGYLYITQGINNYALGSKIYIDIDSTFLYITCGNIMTGKWRCKDGNLFLQIQTNRWRNDSLNKYGWHGVWPIIPDKALKLEIDGDCIICIRQFNEGHKIIEKLRFIDAGNKVWSN